MSRSVSAPSSVTKTSPCWNGFIVPGSTLRYGSSFCMVTRRPRALSREPRLEAVRPLPSEEATPPVTNRCLVLPAGVRSTEVHANTVDTSARAPSARRAGAAVLQFPRLRQQAMRPPDVLVGQQPAGVHLTDQPGPRVRGRRERGRGAD